MAHLVELPPEDMTEDDLRLIDRASKAYYYGEDFKTLLKRIAKNDLTVWRLQGTRARGLIGTCLIERPIGTELWLEFLVGHGFLREAAEIREACHALARRAHAVRLSGTAVRPGLSKLYEKVLGVKPRAQIFTEEFEEFDHG